MTISRSRVRSHMLHVWETAPSDVWQGCSSKPKSDVKNFMKTIHISRWVLLAGVGLSMTAAGADSFREDFNAASITSKLIAPSRYEFGPDATPVGRAQNPILVIFESTFARWRRITTQWTL